MSNGQETTILVDLSDSLGLLGLSLTPIALLTVGFKRLSATKQEDANLMMQTIQTVVTLDLLMALETPALLQLLSLSIWLMESTRSNGSGTAEDLL